MCGCCSSHNSVPEQELRDYKQVKIQIDSYTKGLKSQLKELMMQSGIGGYIQKKAYEGDEGINHISPIHTEIITGGPINSIDEFTDLIPEVVEESVNYEILPYPNPELTERGKLVAVIVKTEPKIINRKNSDEGDDTEADGALDTALLIANQMKNRAKKVLSILSSIPIISDYTGDLNEQFAMFVEEMPRELISAKSLFKPPTILTFSMYRDDDPNLLKASLEARLGIPFGAIELYTCSGILLTDLYTLLKNKECIFVDARITRVFFEVEQDRKSVV